MLNAVVLMVSGSVLIVLGVLGWRGRLPRWRIRVRPFEFPADLRAAGPLVAVGGAVGLLGGVLALSNRNWINAGGPGMLALVVAGLIRGVYAARRAGR